MRPEQEQEQEEEEQKEELRKPEGGRHRRDRFFCRAPARVPP